MTVAPTTIKHVEFQGESIAFYAPRWFRRQRKGKDYRAFARELHTKLIHEVLSRAATQPA